MQRQRRSGAVLLGFAFCVGLALAAPGGAPAAIHQLSGDPAAERPDVAVDSSGTAHVAWNLSAPGDDQLVYCRVPRGARACALTRAFPLPGTDFDGPRTVLTRSGSVVLVSARCCFPEAPVFAVSSADGGSSFGPPATIAGEFSGGSEWEAVLGPGDFSLALSGGNSGPDYASIWSAAPLDGSRGGAKLALAPFPKAYFTSTGFPAPTAPIAAYTDLENVYLRAWDGSGDYNDAANWGQETFVVRGSEPKLASGLRGVYLIHRGPKPPFQYFVRRFNGASFPRGGRKVVSDPATGQSAIFRDFLEDEGGNLHAVFKQRSRKGAWQLLHRASVDGNRSWEKIETLASGAAAEDLFNLRAGAGRRGGAVVGDHNGQGPIWLAPFRSSGGGGGGSACRPTVRLGKAVARALTGCFKRRGNAWVSGGAVKLNGVDIEPLGGGGKASASAGFRVAARPGPRTLTTSGKARVRVGDVVLEKGPVAWRLPPGNGKVVRLNSPDGSVFRDLGRFAKELFEFPVDGDAELLIAGSGTRVPTHLRMPGLLGGVSGKTTLSTDQAGQVLAGMKIDVQTAAIGLLRLSGIHVTYDGANRFTGHAEIELPPGYAKPVEVSFAFADGQLSRLEIEPAVQFDLPGPLPIFGSTPSPIVGLDSIGFLYVRKPASRLFQGKLLLLAGPRVAGYRAVDLDGTVALEFPNSGPTTLKANGALSVVKLPLANASAVYAVGGSIGVPGTLEFGGSYSLGPFSGSVKGFVDLTSGSFSASGAVGLGLFSGKAVLTESGFGLCVNVLGDDYGVAWEWSGGPVGECPGSGAGASATGSAAASATPAVKASVRGRGRKRALRFRFAAAAGRRVTFAEQARGVYRKIASTRKPRGALRFRPAPGPGGRRSIVAIVEQGGVPVDKLPVARYKAPPTRRLARPRAVGVRRRGNRLVVSWKRVGGAQGYEVRVNLARDGRRLLFFPARKRRRLVVKGVERTDLARVTVAAIGPDLRSGREASAKLKPKKRRRQGRRRGGRRSR